MRISTSMMTATMHQSVSNSNSEREKLMKQINSQLRVIVPSDDPIASTWMGQLEQEQSAINQYKQNISRLNNSLTKQEKNISALKNELGDIKDELLAAVNDSRGSLDMASYGNSIEARLESIVTFLNTKSGEGRYIFSGTATGTLPIRYDASTKEYHYEGNSDYRETITANGINVRENTHLQEAFGLQSAGNMSTLSKLKELCHEMKTKPDKASYVSELQDMLGLIDDATNYMAATETELGSRQNRINLLSETHEKNEEANNDIARNLVGLDEIETQAMFLEMQAHQNALISTFKMYQQVNNLSLFNLI
ncbi:flagellin N-terminal helical domain-containing protein [Yersinia frederiksenii]|uniref:flagellin N-terminal helical domain-containing protein n=1 Tax=Yersinia frederiksenii TaxID=29484 RepID=UPI0011A36C39|nr:flagellar biosynthesis protein FlgL [Yersinia frederiksenii]